MSFSSQSSLVLRVVGKPVQTQRLCSTTPEQAELSESSEESDKASDDEKSANETLRAATPPVVFDDEEAWESCSHSSLSTTSENNPLASSDEELGHPLVASTPPVKEKLITNDSEHNSNIKSLINEPMKSSEIPDQVVVIASQEVQETKVVAHPTSIDLPHKPAVAVPSLPSPPTSNLVKKLFPLLDTGKHITATSAASVKQGMCIRVCTSVCTHVCYCVCIHVLPCLHVYWCVLRYLGPIEESPKTVSLKEELETKRYQLEIEIDRFKRENAAINKLRLEREEVCK